MNNESTEHNGNSGNSENYGNNEYMSSQIYENLETSFSLRNKNSTDYEQLNEFFQQRNIISMHTNQFHLTSRTDGFVKHVIYKP